MRHLTIYIFGLLTNIVFGQHLSFKGQQVDTIVIESFSGYYHFDKKGTNTGEGEYYTIAYDKASDKYLVSNYTRKSFKTTYEPQTSQEKEKKFSKYEGTIIPKNIVDSLLKALSVKYKSPTAENIGITRQNFSQLTDEKHILNIAKIYKVDWHFKMSYSTKEKNEIIFKGCQNIDTFNLFLSSKFDTSGYIMVTDVSDVINIYIKAGTKKFLFEAKYPNNFKQPWYDRSDTSNLHSTSILNFDINRHIIQILPDNFNGSRTIGLQALTNPYIKWYLQRKKIIYEYD